MKRSISLLLVFAMLTSMLPMGIFAEEIQPEPEEQERLQYEQPAPEPEAREELAEQVPEQSETAPEEVDSEAEAGTSVQDTEAASQDDPAEPEDDVLQSAPMEALAEMIEDAPEEQGIIASGTCGENLIWELDEEGTLTISGSGAMTNYKSVSDTSSEKPIVPWERYSSQIHTLKIESGVSSIGSCAFRSCLELENVSIPDTVTAIGQEAFYLCAELTGVKLPSGLTQIFPGSFVGCYKLSNIAIPDGVTVIGKDAFKACTGLLRAVIPASVQRIEQDAFLNCTQLRDVYYFGSEGMWEKLADEPILSNSTIHFDYGPYSLTYNANGGSSAPADRTQVGTLSISSETAVWEGHEFLGWARSAHAAQADYGAGDTITLTQDTVLFAVWRVEQIASGTCGENVVWTLDGNGTLTISGTGAMRDYAGGVDSPQYYTTYGSQIQKVIVESGVTRVGNNAFSHLAKMTEATIADTVTDIGEQAFCWCDLLGSITIPSGVTSIGSSAFGWNYALNSVSMWPGIETISARFNFCDSVRDVYFYGSEEQWNAIPGASYTLGKAVKHFDFGDYSLTYDPNGGSGGPDNRMQVGGTLRLSNAVPTRSTGACIGWATNPGASKAEYLPGDVINVNADITLYAVWDMKATASGSCGENLLWLYKEGTLNVYGSGAMTDYTYYDDTWSGRTKAPWTAYRTKISRVVLSEGVTSVGDNAFNGCISLENVIFPDSLQTIGQNAFSGCTAIGKVQLPSNLKNLGNSAFSGCSSLTDVVIPDGLAEIPASAFINTSVKVIAIPASVKTIGADAFWGVNAEKLVFAEGLEEIGNSAFDRYRGKVSLPASVRKIESYAFFNCTEINLGGALPEMQEKCFANARIVRYRSDFAYDLTPYEEKYYAPNAVWAAFRGEDMPYSIRYDANGGEYPPAPQNKIPGESLTLAFSKPWYAGKRFMGWALDANASTARYQPGGVYSEDEDAVLYAVWGNAGTTPDTTAPVLKSITLSAASVDAPGFIDVVADVTDAVSGVNYGWIYLKNAAANKTVVVDLRTTYYDESRRQELSYTDGRLHGKLEVSEFLPGGKYTISQAEFVDRADNRALYGTYSGWKALPTACKNIAFTVNESNPDVTAPELLELYFSASSVTAPGSIEVIADAVDDNSGVDRMFVNLISQEGRQITAYLEPSFYDSMTGEEIPYPDGKLHGKLTLDEFVPGGTYSVRYIDLYDAADNVSFYSDNKNIVNAVPLPVFCRNISLLVRSFGAQVNTSTDAPDFADQIRSAGNDAHIAADYSGCSVVHADVFDALMGTNKVLDLYSGNVVWRFEGQSITDPTKDVELSVQISPVSVGSAATNALALEFANNANLPGPAQVRVHLDDGQQNYLGSRNLQLWYYNAAAGTLELISASVPVSDDGSVSFTIDHCSTYLLVPTGTRLNASAPSRTSGSWNGMQWRYDAELAVLYLSGSGIMADADRPYNAPWYDFAGRVKYLVVGEDIAALGADCFTNLNQLQTVFYCGGIPGGIDANGSLQNVPKVRYAEEICVAQVEPVDISRPDAQVQLAVSFLPEGSMALVNYSAEGQNLSVDADGKVTFTGKSGSGSVFVTDALGMAQSAQTQIETYYYTGASYFRIDTDAPCTDMHVKEEAQVRVFADENQIPGEMLRFTLISGENVIDLKEDGSFTAKAVGNAVIRGELAGADPLGRRALITVQVTRDDYTAAFMEANENGELLLEMQPGAVQTYALHLKNAMGDLDSRAYTFTTGDAKVAKVALNKSTGDITLTVPKGAYGTSIITARPMDVQHNNSVTTLAVHVRNYSPRLSASKVTMNSYATSGVSVPIFPAYESFDAEAGQILEVCEKTKVGYVPSEVFTARLCSGTLEIHTVNDISVSNRTANLRVKIPTVGDVGPMLRDVDLTVTVKNTLPKVTVKQTIKPNLFIHGTAGELRLTCKDAVISDVKFNIDGYASQLRGDTLVLTPTQPLPAKTGYMEVFLEGYNRPVVFAKQAVATVNTKPGLALAKTSGTVHGAGSGEMILSVLDKTAKMPADLRGVTVACVQDGFAAEAKDDGRIVLKVDSRMLDVARKTAYKLNLTLHHDDWAAAVPLSYTLNVLAPNTVPTGKLSASSITLNSRYPENCGRILLTADTPDLPVTEVQFLNLPSHLAMEYDAGTGAITAQLMDTGLPNGSYAVTCRPFCDGRPMKDLKLTVKVTSSAVAVTAAASGKLDLLQPEKTMAYALTIKNLNMTADSVKRVKAISPVASLGAAVADGSEMFNVTVGQPNAKGLPTVNVKLKPGTDYSTKTTYKLRLQCTTACGVELTTADLSIKLSQSKMKTAAAVPSASIYPMGNIFIGYRINVTSDVGQIEKIALDASQTGADYKTLIRGIDTLTWAISEDGRSASVSVIISGEAGLVAGKTYTLPLLITPANADPATKPIKQNLTIKILK